MKTQRLYCAVKCRLADTSDSTACILKAKMYEGKTNYVQIYILNDSTDNGLPEMLEQECQCGAHGVRAFFINITEK